MGDAYGANVKVFYVHGACGSDGNTQDGTSGSNHFGTTGAYKTIQYAFDLVATGTIDDADEIHIMKTTNDALYYRPTAGIGVTWNARDVAVHGSNATGAVDGTIVEIHGGSAGATALMYCVGGSQDYTNFSNLYFNGADTSTHTVHVKDQTNIDLNFINCRFSSGISHGFMSGIDDATDNNYMQFVNCRFDNNGDSGIYHPGANHLMVYKCLVDNNTGIGAYLSQNIKIAESVFYGNTGNGCEVSNGSNISNCVFDSNRGANGGLVVRGSKNGWGMNNIFSNNTNKGIYVWGGRPQSELNPVIYNNGVAYTGNELKIHNMTTTAVAFVDAPNFDFTPTPTSSSIGAGQSQPFAYFGSTADDAGISKWVKTETTSIF